MKDLSAIFSQTLAPAKRFQEREDKKDTDNNHDPMLEAYQPTDSIQLSGASQATTSSGVWQNSAAYRFGSLPTLFKSHSSHTGGLLDIKG